MTVFAEMDAELSRWREEARIALNRAEKAEAEVERLKGSVLGREDWALELLVVIARMREVLEWYANVAHYVHGPRPGDESDASEDSGTRARDALRSR